MFDKIKSFFEKSPGGSDGTVFLLVQHGLSVVALLAALMGIYSVLRLFVFFDEDGNKSKSLRSIMGYFLIFVVAVIVKGLILYFR